MGSSNSQPATPDAPPAKVEVRLLVIAGKSVVGTAKPKRQHALGVGNGARWILNEESRAFVRVETTSKALTMPRRTQSTTHGTAANRNPRKFTLEVGVYLPRCGERHPEAVLHELPPRVTRYDPDVGPQGSAVADER